MAQLSYPQTSGWSPWAGPNSPCLTHVVFFLYQVLGTPAEETWPGVTALPEFKKGQFKNYSKKELGFMIPE